ncbi:MAG: glutamine-hydrolyzing carbamoyl-phosphate synthase small subunit [Clostridia bacterium]|nr:glutamine-hydrolyzing carbamoyl-phosphate synthase small subunit [Clostridia bacterium]
MAKQMNKKIVLEDGSEYYGYGFGADVERVCEIVFDTSMVGYQEIISDPSYTNQMVVMTYTLIGNYGMADEDYESKALTCGALVVREYNDLPSNFRYTKTLAETMEESDIPGIEGFDTRELTRKIRDNGSCKAIITSADTPKEKALAIIAETKIPTNSVPKVSCRKRWYARTANAKYNVVAIDCGARLSVIRTLNDLGCNVTVMPYNVSASEVERMNPDAVLITEGPGNPEDVTEVIDLIKQLKGKYPIVGIGLGHQLVALAYGAKTYKMKCGHHGTNHPVRNLKTGTVRTVSQNHNYAVDPMSVDETGLKVTHLDIMDDVIEGLCCEADRVFTIQYHPDTMSGPSGSVNFYNEFIGLMKEGK